MRFATYRQDTAARRSGGSPLDALDVAWVRFGDEVAIYGDDAQIDSARQDVERAGSDLQERPDDVTLDRLRLVVQNGRLFQERYPDTRVPVDKGRLLLVDIDPGKPLTRDPSAYAVLALDGRTVAFDVREPATARALPEPWIQNLVDRVSAASFRSDLEQLVHFPTRFSTSSQYAAAAGWIKQQLASLGYTTRLERITVRGRATHNVVANKPGQGASSRDLVLITAHLDSINLDGITQPAPGADDNASGSAGLLQIARALHDHSAEHDLRFVAFGGEEEGLLGSRQYVASLGAAELARIRAVVNMDMIATVNTAAPSVLLEGSAVSQQVIDGLAEAADTYTELTVQTSLHAANSDHVPFITRGLPAVLTIEGADHANTNVHSARDTLDHIDNDLALAILRMNTAFVTRSIGQTP
jgi:hypothetical protein